MEDDIRQKLEDTSAKVDKIYESVEKLRKYFFWTLVATLVFFLLPLVGLAFAIPAFLSTYSSLLGV